MDSMSNGEPRKQKTVKVGCGCLGCVTPFIALILLLCCLDILGCDRCKGFTHRAWVRITLGE